MDPPLRNNVSQALVRLKDRCQWIEQALDPPADGEVTIERIQDQDNVITGDFARTSRPCPPFCIQPHEVAPGVSTIGELELLDRLDDPEVMVIDSRELDWYLDGTIPGAVHVPYTEMAGRLDELGCEREDDAWNCEGAREVADRRAVLGSRPASSRGRPSCG